MTRLAPQTLKLRDDEQSELEQLIKRHNTPQQIALRGKIVLYANLGKNNREIARILNISRNMVILWRNRWLASSDSKLLISQRLEDSEFCAATILTTEAIAAHLNGHFITQVKMVI